ncbi:MAG: response regulator [Rhodobacteraceae bacterium]|nr:response regulator [Paracoccaceae bacterium]
MPSLRKILHVEDDPDILEIAHIALADVGGLEVLQCASGHEALRVAEEFDPDLILLDVMMPGLNGEETFTRLRSLDRLKNTPIVFMTAKGNQTSIDRLMRLGAVAVIVKPFDPMSLAEQLDQKMQSL